MSTGFSGSSRTRNYGEFAESSKSSSLFDRAFSKPPPKKRFSKFASTASVGSNQSEEPVLPSVSEARDSPQQVFSPPISLPESSSTADLETEHNLEASDSDDDLMDMAQSSKRTTNFSTSYSQSTGSQNGTTTVAKRSAASTYDFDDDDASPGGSPAPKKEKLEDPILTAGQPKAKFIPTRQQRKAPVYRHKWNEDDDEEEDFGRPSPPTNEVIDQPAVRRPDVPAYRREPASRVRRVKEAHQCLESGELDDFKQDLEYHLLTLQDPQVSDNVKCLSAVTLTRKCVSREFRQFIRSEMGVNQIVKLFSDANQHQSLALCVAAFVYLMSRDFVTMALDSPTLRVISQLLRVETLEDSEETKKYSDQVWSIFKDYLDQAEAAGKKCAFDIPREKLTPSALILDALVFLLSRTQDEAFKTELLNLGALQFVVSKVEKVTLSMIHDKSATDVSQNLQILERCFRILESSTCFHKKNQAFLISHRGSVLIQMCGKLFSVVHSAVADAPSSDLVEKYMNCLGLMARVLMNLSHENELCSSKLGQMNGFLSLCLTTVTFLAPKFGSAEKKFDVYVMGLALLVNLVERCNSNRRKVLEASVKMYHEDGKITEEKALNALVMMFCHHEMKAKNIDEDLDKELAFEDPGDEQEDEESDDGPSQDGRLDRGKLDDMSESEMLAMVQGAMTKASAHMEDSVVASYIALLVGCLLQQNEEYVTSVKELLPEHKLTVMVDQLQRFLEFMKITNSKSSGCRSIERIIDHLERLD